MHAQLQITSMATAYAGLGNNIMLPRHRP